MFITVENLGSWTEDDIETNSVYDREQLEVPSFVEEYERMLGTRRRLPSGLVPLFQHSLRDAPDVYCDANGSDLPPGASNDTNLNEITENELFPLVNVSRVRPDDHWSRKGRDGHSRAFKEPDAAWLWFGDLAFPYKAVHTKGRRIQSKCKRQCMRYILVVQWF
jgi:hypothetical protein